MNLETDEGLGSSANFVRNENLAKTTKDIPGSTTVYDALQQQRLN